MPDALPPDPSLAAPKPAWLSVRWPLLLAGIALMLFLALRECGAWLATVDTMPK